MTIRRPGSPADIEQGKELETELQKIAEDLQGEAGVINIFTGCHFDQLTLKNT